MARRSFAPEVDQAIAAAANRWGIPPQVMRGFATIESGGNPRNSTGSYHGLFQLSNSEFRRGGGTGSILDPHQNAMAAGNLIAGHRAELAKSLGREPSWNEVYMVHQQGPGGFAAHNGNQQGLAWQNMASTAEGRARDAKGPIYRMPDGSRGLWSQAAIANNIPGGSNLNWQTATSGEFLQGWGARLGRAGVPQSEAGPALAGMPGYGDQGAATPDTQPNPPGQPRDLSALSGADLTAMAPPKEPPIDTSGVGGVVDMVAGQLQPQTVAGVNAGGGQSIGALFGGGSAPNLGRALSAAGRAIAGGGIKIPQFTDPATQMAALDSGGTWPTIRPLVPRRQG